MVRIPARAVGIAALLGGCAATTPSAPPPAETLVVLNAGDASLTLLSLVAPGTVESLALGSVGGTPVALAARGSLGLVTTGIGNTVAMIDLRSGSALVRRVANGAGAAGAAFANDSIAYIANPFNNRATRLNLNSGDTTSLAVGRSPIAVAVTRGRVFIANANLAPSCAQPTPCVAGPSWLTVIDPDRNVAIDSIPLPGPGNAMAIQVGGDGLLYVINSGPGGEEPGRLSIVDPVLRQEVGSFAGFGVLPAHLASDGRERLFVTSPAQGLMEFNMRIRRVVRGAGSGIPLQGGVSAAVDANGTVYAVESGSCVVPSLGRVRVFRPDLTEARIVSTGVCPVDATIVRLPPKP